MTEPRTKEAEARRLEAQPPHDIHQPPPTHPRLKVKAEVKAGPGAVDVQDNGGWT